MSMSTTRWNVIAESQFPWERDALEWLRSLLPDRDPWHAWTNFEFIDDEGKVNEVDALILSPAGLFLVEIKSRPGVVTGDPHTWTWTTDSKTYTYDNPLILANRKAKRLASVLRRQQAVFKSKSRIPFVEPCIFLSATSLNCKLTGTAAAGVYMRGRPGSADDKGIIAALNNGISGIGHHPIDHHQARTLAQAMVQAGIRPSNKHRKVGDYQLGALITEGENYQDWEGQHTSIETIRRRVRIYPFAVAATEQARMTLVRQAAREFQILEGIEHSGILKVRDYKETELGPALIFDHDAKSRRLDFLLREQGSQLNVDQRLHLVRNLAETLKYAHQKKLFHRALCPQSILVRDPESALPALQIMNWQTGARDSGTGGTTMRTVGTMHVEEYVEDPGRVYLAPESSWQQENDGVGNGPHSDVFSLGAIAYHIFSGQPPAATSIELHEKLRAGPGLRISDVMDGAGQNIQDLIQFSTIPDISARFNSVEEFLKSLDDVEDELTRPDPETTVDPSVATANERIEGGFTVVRRLGKGSSSDVLVVKQDGNEEELVLKVASDPAYNDRLINEGEALSKLRHPNVVEWRKTLSVAGRTAILMCRASEHTLAQRLHDEAGLSLDLTRRFGDELIQVIDYLESQGIAHRDIKPENIGIAPSAATKKLQLVLFDFSLSGASPENISAGTHPYLDPFLQLRKPPRWDLYAERFALAVTLYEMVTGELPRWGDGKTQPAMLDCEVNLDADRFDPHLREGLIRFFDKALRRDYKERFDNAEEMLRAWRKIFEDTAVTDSEPDNFAAIAQLATASTSIAELGYSVEAQNVLEGMGIHAVRDLLAVDRIKFRYLTGVGDRIRKEIRLKAKKLAQLRPDLAQGRSTQHGGDTPAPGISSIDELAAQLLPKRPAGDDRPEEHALALYLGLEQAESETGDHTRWTTLGDAARLGQLARSEMSNALLKARERWLKLPSLTQIRGEIETLLDTHIGVMTVPELAFALLAARGSANQDDALRLRLASAVVRACQEAESSLAKPRYQLFEHEPMPLLALGPDQADYAKRLAASADQIAQADPLLAPQHALKTLESVERPAAISALSVQRLLRLATAASRTAALSSRLEIYPRGLSAIQAMRLSYGALTGPRFFKAEDIIVRVQGRYPEAEPIPGRPLLDTLLAETGSGLTWNPAGANGPGYYPPVNGLGPSAGMTTYFTRRGTQCEPALEVTSDIAEARQFEERMEYARKAGGFLALTVPLRLARHAEAELLRRYAPERLSFDTLLIQTLREQAQTLKVDWNTVLQADAAAPGSRDWTNLTRLVQKALPVLKQRLLQADKPILLVHPGLLARFQAMGLIEELRDLVGSNDAPPALWLLVPMVANGLPAVDGVPVPVISSAQWARIPQAWVENAHRAGTGTTSSSSVAAKQ
jgi:serine/threonine protein kinase